jgi:hypothetical protein
MPLAIVEPDSYADLGEVKNKSVKKVEAKTSAPPPLDKFSLLRSIQ